MSSQPATDGPRAWGPAGRTLWTTAEDVSSGPRTPWGPVSTRSVPYPPEAVQTDLAGQLTTRRAWHTLRFVWTPWAMEGVVVPPRVPAALRGPPGGAVAPRAGLLQERCAACHAVLGRASASARGAWVWPDGAGGCPLSGPARRACDVPASPWGTAGAPWGIPGAWWGIPGGHPPTGDAAAATAGRCPLRRRVPPALYDPHNGRSQRHFGGSGAADSLPRSPGHGGWHRFCFLGRTTVGLARRPRPTPTGAG